MILPRRSFITGLVSLIAAPAIVRAGSLMPVKSMYTKVTRITLDYSDMDPRWKLFSHQYNWNLQVVASDWQTISRIINIDIDEVGNA